MKQQTNRWFFPLLSLGLGLLAGGCRFMLYAAGLDGKGLILAHHPAAIALWILTGLACAAAAAGGILWRGENRAADGQNCPVLQAAGYLFMAGGICSTLLIPEEGGIPILMILHRYAAYAAVAALIAGAVCRLLGKPVPFFCPALASVFLLIHALARYRVWSSDPQPVDYLFALGASLCLCLFAYCETALSVRLEGRRQRLITGILGIFFTVATSARGEYELLHLGGALWMILTLLTGQSGEKAEDAG